MARTVSNWSGAMYLLPGRCFPQTRRNMNGFSVGISKVYNALVSDCSCHQLSAFPRSWQKMKRNAFVQCVYIAVETMLWIWGLNPDNCSHNQTAQRRNYCSLYYYTKIKLPTWLATRWKPIRKHKLKIWSQTSKKYWHHLIERMICKQFIDMGPKL